MADGPTKFPSLYSLSLPSCPGLRKPEIDLLLSSISGWCTFADGVAFKNLAADQDLQGREMVHWRFRACIGKVCALFYFPHFTLDTELSS